MQEAAAAVGLQAVQLLGRAAAERARGTGGPGAELGADCCALPGGPGKHPRCHFVGGFSAHQRGLEGSLLTTLFRLAAAIWVRQAVRNGGRTAAGYRSRCRHGVAEPPDSPLVLPGASTQVRWTPRLLKHVNRTQAALECA